jgi:hypothetical protein
MAVFNEAIPIRCIPAQTKDLLAVLGAFDVRAMESMSIASSPDSGRVLFLWGIGEQNAFLVHDNMFKIRQELCKFCGLKILGCGGIKIENITTDKVNILCEYCQTDAPI